MEHTIGDFTALKDLSKSRKVIVLVILYSALFLDMFNSSALFAAIPPVALQLDILDSQTVWLLDAYQLIFAALLLVVGLLIAISVKLERSERVFVLGAAMMGVFALIAGFIRNKIPLIILRARMGAGGALTIPSAQHLMYPDPDEQAKVIAIFGDMGRIGIVIGLIIGAILSTFVSWPGVFCFGAIVSTLITLSIFVLVLNVTRNEA